MHMCCIVPGYERKTLDDDDDDDDYFEEVSFNMTSVIMHENVILI